MIPSAEALRAMASKILGLSGAGEALVRLGAERRGNTRFANNGITTAGSSEDLTVTVVSVFGKRHGAARTNVTDEASLARVVRRSEELARLSPADPEWLPVLPPQTYLKAEGLDSALGDLGPEARASRVIALTGRSNSKGLLSSGFFEHSSSATALASSASLFAYSARNEGSFSTTARTRDGAGSGWAGLDFGRLIDLDAERLGRLAMEKAARSASPKELPPGKYTVILEPQAVADLMGSLAFSLDARSADEGRSVFSRPGGGTRIGERMLSERVDLISDPTASGLAGSLFDEDGLPAQRITWFDRGALRHLLMSRYWAHKTANRPTGPMANLILPGGTDTVEEMIRTAERAVLVTRFWYIRFVDPQTLLLTGITRDGTFLVENGKIARAVSNFRFNESPITMLRNVEMISAPRQVAGGSIPMAMPAIRSRDFTFSSVSRAV